ncbi:hypothetical protein SCYAM73S_00973 [Streptomyces cyaneofuscatus]
MCCRYYPYDEGPGFHLGPHCCLFSPQGWLRQSAEIAEGLAAKKGVFTGAPPGPKHAAGSPTEPLVLAQGAYKPQ